MNHPDFKYRVFGRTKGRSNKKINIDEYYGKINKYIFSVPNKNTNYILDIGTGYGESTIFLSNNFKKNTIISCETYISGNLNLIKKIEINKTTNIKIFPGNVNQLLDNLNPHVFFKFIWILFPDPWPKKKHFKRRLITDNFLKKLNIFLDKDGEIFIATDSYSYSQQILKCIFNIRKTLYWKNQTKMHLGLRDFYELETKFYNKAIISGRKSSIFILKKI